MKKFIYILIFIFLVIFSFFNFNEFKNNYKQNINYKKELLNINNKLESFNLNKIQKINNLEFYYTPYKELLDKIVKKIDKAEKRVYIEIYMFTENYRLPKALIRAKKRGVEVKVLLEKNPYKSPNINNKIYKILKNNNIEVNFSNSSNYSLNHSKFYIIDDEVIISTGNLTYSTFTHNRDFFVFFNDKNLLNIFEKIFENDFAGVKFAIYHPNLVLSPVYARQKFEKLFLSAHNSLKMYFQYLEDKTLEDLLIKKAKSGVSIKIIVSKNFFEKNKDKITFLRKNNIKVSYLKNIKMHAKAILVDNKVLFIGSQNFSFYSLNKNREIGILFNDKEDILKFNNLFNKDFAGN